MKLNKTTNKHGSPRRSASKTMEPSPRTCTMTITMASPIKPSGLSNGNGCATTARSSGVSVALNRFILKKMNSIAVMMVNFFKMNLFKATLTPELRAEVAQQDQEQMTVKKMFMHATMAQREGKTKPPAAVNKISKDNSTTDAADDKNDVAAFNRRARPKQNQLGGQSQGGFNSG
jgi:hypothetical protein